MRKLLLAGLAAVTAVGAGSVPARGSSDTGTYRTPFREDGAAYVDGTFTGGSYAGQSTDANGCVSRPVPGAPDGNPDAYDCLPAAASVSVLGDGRVLYWNALEGTENLTGTDSAVPDGGRLTVDDEARVLTLTGKVPSWSIPTPRDGGAHQTATDEDLPLPAPLAASHYPYNNGSLFCSDQVQLADGSILSVGGTDYYSEPTVPGTDKGFIELEGIRSTRIFLPRTDAWVQAAPMNHGRWYPSLVTLGNGQVFVGGGVTKLIKPLYPSHPTDSGTNVRPTETYDPAADRWTDNGLAAARSLPLFPRLHLLPDGHVYYDAAGQAYNPQGQSYDEALWNVATSYHPEDGTWHDLDIPGMGTPFPGFRGSTFSAALELRPDRTGAYRGASFLTAGGVLFPTPGSYIAVADSRITTVSTNESGAEQLSTVGTGPLGRGRWYSTAVPLPDGTVYAVNGADVDEVVTPGHESPILTAELFTPAMDADGNYAGGAWRDAGTVARGRTYHNTAVLLADGRVLIGGHAPIPAGYHQVQDGADLPGRPGANNHHDASFQIYEPPYIGKPRPSIEAIAQRDRTLVVSTPDAAHIADVVLVRNAALTHLVDGDARTVQLPVVGRTGSSVTVALPASTNVLPNGPYLLFANQNTADPADDGPGHVVPSVGRRVFVVGTSSPDLVVAPAVAAAASSAQPRPAAAATGRTTALGGADPSVRPSTRLSVGPADDRRRRVPVSARGSAPALGGLALAVLVAITAGGWRGARRRRSDLPARRE